MKKILIIYHGWGIGGGLIALMGLIQELKKEYIINVLCIYKSEAIDEIKKLEIQVICAESFFYKKIYKLLIYSEASYSTIPFWVRSILSLGTFFLNKFFFTKYYFENLYKNYDIIYLNSLFVSDWAYLAKQNKKKVILHVREPLKNSGRDFISKIIKKNIKKYVDVVIAISRDNASRLDLLEKTKLVYDPVLLFDRNNDDSGLLYDSELKYFVYTGGSQRIKGYENLVKALPYLSPNIRIIFLGHIIQPALNLKLLIRILLSPYSYSEFQLGRKLVKAHNAILMGGVKNVFQFYRNSIAVIIPFARPHAALPIIESYSIGRPIIATDIEGMKELVGEGTGIITDNTYKGLAQAINDYAQLSERELFILSQNCLIKYRQIKEASFNVSGILRNL